MSEVHLPVPRSGDADGGLHRAAGRRAEAAWAYWWRRSGGVALRVRHPVRCADVAGDGGSTPAPAT